MFGVSGSPEGFKNCETSLRGTGDAQPRSRHTFPGIHTSPKGAHPFDPMGFEKQRRTGAGSFVRSTAKENDFAVAGNLLRTGRQVLNGEADRAGNGDQIRFHAAAQVDNV